MRSRAQSATFNFCEHVPLSRIAEAAHEFLHEAIAGCPSRGCGEQLLSVIVVWGGAGGHDDEGEDDDDAPEAPEPTPPPRRSRRPRRPQPHEVN